MKPRNIGESTQSGADERVVASYLRVSTDEQAESGLGLADQLARTSAMATVKGWPAPVVYRDEGISGTKGLDKRPGLARLMNDVRAGKVQAVIILALDRLGRDTRMVLNLVDEIDSAGVVLVSCKESFDSDTPQGKFVLRLFASLAELERDMISQRTKGAIDSKVRAGEDKGGRPPYAYVRNTVRSESGKIISSQITIDEDAARVVREMFEAYDSGVSMREIAADLNRAGVRAPRGGLWYHTSVREILANREAYEGGGSRGQSHFTWPKILGVEEELVEITA